ncbi:SPAG1 [Mytilus edulis]|uniref:SPAG1 n=1 Tax=Mytilus edulis TaxID=6550 RepID=A0A8S3PQ80_MYTED|nr:SPAG1 [Mytilus edulis]
MINGDFGLKTMVLKYLQHGGDKFPNLLSGFVSMSTVSDNVLFQSETTRKYDIPLTHLDYPYIEKCTDTKELERILRILRSGDEGFYPDLETFCEERIEKLNPKSRVLRKEVPLGRPGDLAKDEWKKIDTDLKTWEMDMKTTESSKKRYTDSFDDPELPPIRSGFMNGASNQSNEADAGKKSKRVTPRDYKEWDKFDIDKELDDVDKKDKKEEKKHTKSSTVVPHK